MKLLLITSVYPSRWRPTKGTFNHELVTALRLAGDDVRIVVPIPWTDRFRETATLPASPHVSYPTWWYPPRIGHAGFHHWMSPFVLPAARRMARNWNPDLVMGYWTHPDGTLALSAARSFGVPGVVLAGGSDVQLLTRDEARRRIIVKTLEAADKVFTVGTALRDSVVDLGISSDRVAAFSRGVDLARFSPGPQADARTRLGLPLDRPVLLWVGRMVPVKGLDLLMRAWRDVASHPSRPLLVLVGDGEERQSLERAASPLGDAVRFAGTMPYPQLPDWYRAADAVLLPSRSEGIPNVLLEGLACGTPFIASAVGGVKSLADAESVLLPSGDLAAWTGALLSKVGERPMSVRASASVLDRSEAIAAFRTELAAVVAAGINSAAHAA